MTNEPMVLPDFCTASGRLYLRIPSHGGTTLGSVTTHSIPRNEVVRVMQSLMDAMEEAGFTAPQWPRRRAGYSPARPGRNIRLDDTPEPPLSNVPVYPAPEPVQPVAPSEPVLFRVRSRETGEGLTRGRIYDVTMQGRNRFYFRDDDGDMRNRGMDDSRFERVEEDVPATPAPEPEAAPEYLYIDVLPTDDGIPRPGDRVMCLTADNTWLTPRQTYEVHQYGAGDNSVRVIDNVTGFEWLMSGEWSLVQRRVQATDLADTSTIRAGMRFRWWGVGHHIMVHGTTYLVIDVITRGPGEPPNIRYVDQGYEYVETYDPATMDFSYNVVTERAVPTAEEAIPDRSYTIRGQSTEIERAAFCQLMEELLEAADLNDPRGTLEVLRDANSIIRDRRD